MWNWTENQIKIIWIRHGATSGNKEHRYIGKTDESLSSEGVQTLKENREKGCYPNVSILFSSPMKRCLETAGILYPDQPSIIIPEWEEMDFGEFEGKNYIELQDDKKYQEWIESNGTLPFPKGESREAFIVRCKCGFERMLLELVKSPQCGYDKEITVGIVVHGGTIMAVLSSFCGGNYFDYQVKNGHGFACEIKKEEDKVHFLNVQNI